MRASANSDSKGHKPCKKRPQKYDTAYKFKKWRQYESKQEKDNKSNCRLFEAVKIGTRIPFRPKLGDFLVPFSALLFFSLFHFFKHNRYPIT